MNLDQVLATLRPCIQKMQGYVSGEQPSQVASHTSPSPALPASATAASKFIKLNTNENPYPPSPKVALAIQQAANQGLQLYPDPHATAFRMRAADLYDLSPDHFLCGNGSDDILTILTRAFVGEGERLRMPYPSYILYKTLADLQNAQADTIPFTPEFALSPDFSHLHPQTKLIYLPNPNSPSGTLIPKSALRQLAQSFTCPLVIDEAYVDFANDHCIDLVREFPHVFVTRTLSKSYALAGLRFGFVMAHPDLIRELRKVKDSYNCDSLSIAAATAAIDDQTWLSENRNKVLATRDRMTSRLRTLGFQVPDSHGNFVWCTWPNRPLQPLYEQLKQQRILVRYMNYHGWGEGLRISVGTDSHVDAALMVLESLL